MEWNGNEYNRMKGTGKQMKGQNKSIKKKNEIEGNIKEMGLENLNAKITIDAKTFIPKEFDVIAKYTKAKDGQTVLTWDFSYKATYTDINGVKEIVIPNEVKNSRNADPK